MATHRNQDADASSCVLATLSPCQHVGEIMAAAAGCGLPAGVRTIPEHPPDMRPITVLEKEFAVRTLPAMTLAVTCAESANRYLEQSSIVNNDAC